MKKGIVLLKYYEGYTFQEIADTLQIPLGTVKSILYRALKKLRVQVEEADFYG
ncbi:MULTISPECIES: RNA polymerase sigma factor [unclassified Lysinibacillus]|uniref:RNA polymerase sigma factor n=1 Tax=unclassified Lysinibacillus TaxID=2636778 RepID=UPI0037FF0759